MLEKQANTWLTNRSFLPEDYCLASVLGFTLADKATAHEGDPIVPMLFQKGFQICS
jgi:hypothetical protein